MATAKVEVFQRHAHVAGAVKLKSVNGCEGKIAKAALTAISDTRRGSGDAHEDRQLCGLELRPTNFGCGSSTTGEEVAPAGRFAADSCHSHPGACYVALT